jgi:hypothetical protein
MKRPIAWTQELTVAGLVLCLLGFGSMALGFLMIVDINFDAGSDALLGYLMVSGALVVGGVLTLLLVFMLE